MRIGFGAPVSGSWATPAIVNEVAARADELGYATLWSFQRLLFPEGTFLSESYHSVLDPMVALGYLAARTSRIRLGVAVVNLPFVSPILLAKQAATIDTLSSGRLSLGLGLGWADEEFVASGADTQRRGARAEEYIACLDAIFAGAPDFAGEFYRIPRAEVLPRPVQQPRPPILLGGTAPAALRRAGRLADGWISSSRTDLTAISDSIRTVRTAADEAGRNPADVSIVVRGVLKFGAEGGADRTPLTGSAGQIRDDLAQLGAQGVDEVFLDLNFDPDIGNPAADPQASLRTAHQVLEAFAPAGSSSIGEFS
jgi:probable F420-dependent oxidoreductase